MAIISRDHGRRLVREGKAREDGLVAQPGPWPEGVHYVILTRHDTQKTDHYPATTDDEDRIIAMQSSAASTIGRIGGKVTGGRKAEASRTNGRRGGRPRKGGKK